MAQQREMKRVNDIQCAREWHRKYHSKFPGSALRLAFKIPWNQASGTGFAPNCRYQGLIG
jgi:hypothetical protein